MLKNKLTLFLSLGALLIVDLILIVLTEPSFRFINGGKFNMYEEAFIEPFFLGSLFLISTIVFLTFFPIFYFKNWLKYIASWYIPVSVFFISQISIHSSSILSIDRSRAALWWMGGLFLITVIYVIVQKYILRKV